MQRTRRYKKILAAGILVTAGFCLCALIGAATYVRNHGDSYRAVRARWGGAQYLDSVGVVRQAGVHDCGVACLTMVFRDAGRDTVSQELAVRLGLAGKDASLYQLTQAAHAFGFEAQAWVLSAADMERARKPLIAFINGNHFVVVDSADQTQVIVRDPALGRLRFSKDAFLARWHGESLVFGSAESMFSVSSVPGDRLLGYGKRTGAPAVRSPSENRRLP